MFNNYFLDKAIVEELKPWKAAVDAVATQVHGYSRVVLESLPCMMRECNIGNFITDAFVQPFIDIAGENEWTYASIAIQNSGGIRTSLSKGSKYFFISFLLNQTLACDLMMFYLVHICKDLPILQYIT